uniref:Uncharacterized protein n=1 Tax=Arundo donax TaxID=35708 RepID=A0A0A9AV27_ARUDO
MTKKFKELTCLLRLCTYISPKRFPTMIDDPQKGIRSSTHDCI